MAVGNINKVDRYVADDFKPYREFIDRVHKIITKKHCDGKVIKWREEINASKN